MIVLGYNCYVFDSAACLFRDGKIIAAAQEERFCRRKGTGEFPKLAIDYCLKEAGISIDDVDHVAFYWDPLIGLPQRFIQILKGFPRTLNFWSSHSGKWWSLFRAEQELRREFPSVQGKSKFKFHNVKHHISHAAGTFFISPFEESCILVMDGSGEISSTSLAIGKKDQIETLEEVPFPHSMGYLYVSLTHYLGFKPDSDEYKVMALTSMGESSEYYEKFCDIIKLKDNGLYEFDLSYFNYQKGIREPWVSQKFIKEFGPLRKKGEELTDRHRNIAWALQKRLQDVALHAADYMYEKSKIPNLVLGGGCALNCVMNEFLQQNSKFENVWVVPAPNDAGTGIGAATWVFSHQLKRPRKYVMDSAYLGPEFSNEECKEALDRQNIEAQHFTEDQLVKEVAQLISQGQVVGWFQGRAEFGPRALGNRSILADPRRQDMKDILNAKIKHRESFRPFAPAVKEDKVQDYFKNGRPLPFMVFVVPIQPDKIEQIPAVSHSDGTARVQTVSPQSNPKFYSLIDAFDQLTGTPMLVNTSFNDSGEPIVNTPDDALRSFRATNLDYLVLGDYLISRNSL